MAFEIGDKVRRSPYALRYWEDLYHNCGREPAKSTYRKALERERAVQGTVTALLDPGIRVITATGTTCDSLSYLWEKDD